MKRRQPAVLAVSAVLVAACGGGQQAAATPRMDHQTAKLLAADVAAVRYAAERRDRARGERALAELTRNVAQAQAQGRLSAEKAQTILAASGRVAEDFQAMPAPRRPAPTASAEPKDGDEHKDEHKGENHEEDDD